jgi:presenilin-like A22 family membrane protease
MLLESRIDVEKHGRTALSTKRPLGLVYLVPILVSMLFGALCSYLVLTSSFEAVQIIPFAEGTVGSLFNGVYFVILAGIGATLLYFLLKKRSYRLITLIIGFAMTTAVFMLSMIYLLALFSIFDVPYSDVLILALPLITTALADYAIFKRNDEIANLIILGIGGGLGAFLGFSIPTESTVLILAFLAVYDAFTVYRGPVGKMAQIGLERFRGLSLSFKDMQIGLGDLTFYSMLSGHMLTWFGYTSCAASMIGIMFGCLLSFRMLARKGMFPGLPIPILFGLIAGLLVGAMSSLP